MRTWRLAIAAIVAASLAGVVSSAATGAGLQPLDLRVDGGEEAWHATPSFSLRWRNPAGSTVAAVHYRLLNPLGQISTGETTIDWAATSIEGLHVPFAPGAYTAEVWLENAKHELGAPVPAKLRFDRTVPGHVDPQAVPGWIGRTAFPFAVRLGHPSGPEPLSGIRGYAISVDRDAEGKPCAGVDLCGELETDLHGGTGSDSLALADLPEGTSYVHAVAVSGSGMRSGAVGTTPLRVDKTDPLTQLAGIPSGWSNRPLTLTARAIDGASGMVATGSGANPFTAIRIDGGTPIVANGDAVAATVIASGIHAIAYYARDAAGNTADGGTANGQPNHAPAAAVVRIDRDAPRLAFVNAQDPRDPERIEAQASDSLSGLDPSGGLISVRRAGSTDRFEELPTELSDGLLRARWDSGSYPAGNYEFRAAANDLAGNEAATRSRANGSAMLISSPLKTPTRLLAGFGGSVLEWHRCRRVGARRRCHHEAVREFDRRPVLRTVPYGRSASFSGRLIAGRRAPLEGMPVQVVERFDAGAEPRERVSTVRTAAGGAFSVHLAPGPSRQVVAIAPPTATLRGSSSHPVRLAVQAGVRMLVSPAVAEVGGSPVVFRGSVAGESIPADGKAVELQFRLPGLPWSEFRTIRTDRRGRFRYAYRFADDDSRGVRFRFRALVPSQDGWPFEPAKSRPLSVRGM